MGILIKALIIAIGAYFAFKMDIAFGFGFLLLALVYLYFSNYSNLMTGRANAEYTNKNYEKALFYFEKAIKRGRPSLITHTGYALMLLRCGKPKEALERINGVLSTMNLPQNIKLQAKQIRALINYHLGEWDEAYEEASELYEDGYQTSNMRALLGLLKISVNVPAEEALSFCEDAYDYDSDNRDILDNYLIALINSNKLDKAEEISEELLGIAPDFVESYYHSALLYQKLGDKKHAKELLGKIADCDRNNMTTVSESEIENLKKVL